MRKMGYVYILTNCTHSVLYIGVTSCLKKRMYEHLNEVKSNFTTKYNVKKLVNYEVHDFIEDAIAARKKVERSFKEEKEYFSSNQKSVVEGYHD